MPINIPTVITQEHIINNKICNQLNKRLNAWQSVSIVTIRTVAMERVLHKHKLQFNSMFTHTHTSQGYDDRVSISNWFMMSIW